MKAYAVTVSLTTTSPKLSKMHYSWCILNKYGRDGDWEGERGEKEGRKVRRKKGGREEVVRKEARQGTLVIQLCPLLSKKNSNYLISSWIISRLRVPSLHQC
jgi:hypothetical protein